MNVQTRPSAQRQEEEDVQQAKFLTFELGSETYGLDITYVREIVGMQTITHVPDTPGYVRGVINLRGKVIPIMDVRARFNLPDRSYDDRTCIIVINVNEWWVGLVVDTVSEVLDIPEVSIEPPPQVGTGSSHFIEGMGMVGDKVRLLLDAERLLGAAAEL
ncbi:MAG: chemotaxis protein CheW [Myxococcota bacterium]